MGLKRTSPGGVVTGRKLKFYLVKRKGTEKGGNAPQKIVSQRQKERAIRGSRKVGGPSVSQVTAPIGKREKGLT